MLKSLCLSADSSSLVSSCQAFSEETCQTTSELKSWCSSWAKCQCTGPPATPWTPSRLGESHIHYPRTPGFPTHCCRSQSAHSSVNVETIWLQTCWLHTVFSFPVNTDAEHTELFQVCAQLLKNVHQPDYLVAEGAFLMYLKRHFSWRTPHMSYNVPGFSLESRGGKPIQYFARTNQKMEKS